MNQTSCTRNGCGRRQQYGEVGAFAPDEAADQVPEGEKRDGGKGHHRQPVGHEPLGVEGQPGVVGTLCGRAAAGEQHDRAGGEPWQRPATGKVVRPEQGPGEGTVGAFAPGDELGDFVGDAAVGTVANLEGSRDRARVEFALWAERPERPADREPKDAADDEQDAAFLPVEEPPRPGPQEDSE